MGLDVSHGDFSMAYSAFNRFRQAIAKAAGAQFPPHDDPSLDRSMIYWPDDFTERQPGLAAFLTHSDCDGEIDPETCVKIADEMTALLPNLEQMGDGGGHIARAGGLAEAARQFIAAARAAATAGEPLEFC